MSLTPVHDGKDALKYLAIGGTSSAISLVACLPFIHMKNSQQAGFSHLSEVKTLGLRRFFQAAFCGWGPMALSCFPATGVALAVDKVIQHRYERSVQRKANVIEQVAFSVLGAVASSPFVSLSELVMMHQARLSLELKRDLSALDTMKELVRQKGPKVLSRGIIPTNLREIPFNIAFITFASSHPIYATVIGAVATQAFDSWKTRVQYDLSKKITFKASLNAQPFKGFTMRLMMYAIFMNLGSPIKDKMEKALV